MIELTNGYSQHGIRQHVDAALPISCDSAPCGDHTVQFYLDDSHLTESVGRFIGAALAAGDAAVVVATAEHIAEIDRCLDVIDLNRARADGRYLTLDAPTTLALLLRDGQPDAELFDQIIGAVIAHAMAAARTTNPRVAVYGELVALLSLEGKHDGALALETFWNTLIASHPISLHCGYPIHAFSRVQDGEALRAICDSHTAVIPAETYPITGEEEERRRATAVLQQRSHVLESETKERQRAESAVRLREAELVTALASRDEFLMAAAHELRTPVTSLRVYAQLLQRDLARKQAVDPDRLALALQAIERQTGQLTHLVGQLLDIAQIETTTLHLDRIESDLVTLIRSVLAEHERAGTHAFVLDVPPQVMLPVDPSRITQVITILVTNAVKFSPAGSTVTLRVEPTDSGFVRLSVTDQGPGIESDQRDQIFERFHRAHGQRHLNGLGLGLYVARQIVQLHGGAIRVEGPDAPGARFVIDLPATA